MMISRLVAQRLGGVRFFDNPYFYRFGKLKQLKQTIEQQGGVPLIDLGIGEPDEKASKRTIEILSKEAEKKENRFYSDNGISELKTAFASYYETNFNVHLNPETEINHCLGTKSALTILPLGFINPNDFVLTTVPGYVVLANMVKWLGGAVYPLPLRKENGFLPDLDAIPLEVLKKTKMMYLNYPNNPTGASATSAFFEKVVNFAKQNQILIVHDAAYLPLTFDKSKRISFLSVAGAKEVGVEIFTLSKGFNMTGWRIGAVLGNSEVIKVFSTVKDNCDSGQFIPIQKAAAAALADDDFTNQLRDKYERRHHLLNSTLQALGFSTSIPDSGFYQYIQIPKSTGSGTTFETAEEFAYYLLSKHRIMTIPWDEVGHYVRLSVTFEASRDQEVSIVHDLYHRLKDEHFVF